MFKTHSDEDLLLHPRKNFGRIGALCSAVMLFFCGCGSTADNTTADNPALTANNGKVKYFPAVMEGKWSLEIEDIKAEFEFNQDGLRDLWEVAGKSFPTATRAMCRNRFTLPEAGRVVLGMGCDWWLVCRIDGKEILSTLAHGNRVYPVAVDNYVYEIDLDAGIHEIELDVKCGDLSFMTAFGNVEPVDTTIMYEPLLTDFAPGRVTVGFVTGSGVPAAVDYRKKGETQWTRAWHLIGGQKASLERVHRVELRNLAPDTDYEYRLVTEHPHRNYREDYSIVRSFRSAPDKFREFSVLIIGDTQGAWSDRTARVKTITQQDAFKRADLLGHVGDYCDSTADIEQSIFPGLFDTYNGKLLLPVRGNHEYLGKESTLWFKYFGNSMKLMKYADTAFLLIDCGNGVWKPAPAPSVMNVPEPFWAEQKEWLEKAVASEEFQSARYRVLLAHGTPFGDASADLPGPIRDLIDPVFGGSSPRERLDLWVGGHLHIPMRSIPGKNQFFARQELKPQKAVGTNYKFPIVLLGGPRGKEPEWNLSLTSVELLFTADGIRCQHRDLSGDLMDDFTVQSGGKVQTNFIRSDFKIVDVTESTAAKN